MSSKAKYPKASATEKQLQQEQLTSLQRERSLADRNLRTEDLLSPFMYQRLGLTPQYGPGTHNQPQSREQFDAQRYLQENPDVAQSGQDPWEHYTTQGYKDNRQAYSIGDTGREITGFTEAPKSQADLNQEQILQLAQEREMKALKGELPVDASLMSDLKQREDQLRQSLSKKFGPGYETSTGGTQALSDFERARQATLDAVRRGDINTGEALNLSQTGLLNDKTANFLGQTSGVAGMTNPFISAYGNNATGAVNALNYYSNDRARQAQFNLANQGGGFMDYFRGALGGALAGGASGAAAGGIGGFAGAGVGALTGLLGTPRRGY